MYESRPEPKGAAPSAPADALETPPPTESTITRELPGTAGRMDALVRVLRVSLGFLLVLALTLAIIAAVGIATIYVAVTVGGIASIFVWLAGVVAMAASTRLLYHGPSFDETRLIPYRWAFRRD